MAIDYCEYFLLFTLFDYHEQIYEVITLLFPFYKIEN